MNLKPASSGFVEIYFGIVIVCEDTNANYIYLQDKIKQCLPNSIDTYVYKNSKGYRATLKNSQNVGHTNPRDIAKYAIDEINCKNADYQNNEDDIEPLFYQEVYCVVDVDDNVAKGMLAQAYQVVSNANVANPKVNYRLIVSNECFEIWYILHIQDIPSPLYRGTKTQKAAGLITPNRDNLIEKMLRKAIDWENLPTSQKPKNKNIKSYAHFYSRVNSIGSESDAIHRAKSLINQSNGKEPFDNPSTELHILIEKINSFK